MSVASPVLSRPVHFSSLQDIEFRSSKDIERFLKGTFPNRPYWNTKGVFESVANHFANQTVSRQSLEKKVEGLTDRIMHCLSTTKEKAVRVCHELATALIAYA